MSDLLDRLDNWGHCVRVHWRKGHCQSIEHRYQPERIVGEGWETRQTPKLILDHRDADLIEQAWRKVSDRKAQQVLKLAYVWRAAPGFICRRLGIQTHKDDTYYLLELGRAQRAIKRVLEVETVDG